MTYKGLYPSGECALSESDGLGIDGNLWLAPPCRILCAAFLLSMSRRLYGGWNAQIMKNAMATAAAVMKYMAYLRSGTFLSSETCNTSQTNMKIIPVPCLKGKKCKTSYSAVFLFYKGNQIILSTLWNNIIQYIFKH